MAQTGSVPAGTRVGRYEIVSLLGRGGMGEVYAANDSNLGRRVALKILPGNRTSDPERVARFVREAHASSALNHPAIVSVHDAGSEGNVHFLAMELIDGEPLTAWMRSSRNVARGAEVMAQVAEGLARAHAGGIVHRDLKPDNIMITRDGYAKIVDFGVAKLTERIGGRGLTGVTTPTSRIGTTAYMSPEQVEGKFVDHRSDVFSFGTVLYELLTGTNPFASPQYADTLHNIVHLDPPLDRVPPRFHRIVRRCLHKDPERRYQSMKDAALDLREAVEEVEAARPRRRLLVPALALLLLAALVPAFWYFVTKSRRSEVAPVPAPQMLMTRLTNSGKVQSAAISPDGKYLAYAEDEGDLQAVYVKQIATGTVTRIVPAAPAYYYSLRVSGDGNYVYYSSTPRNEPNIASIYRVPLLGGVPQKIAHDTEFQYSLSADGKKVAFVRLNAFDREFRLTTAETDGGGEEILMRRRAPEYIGSPMWEPSGESLTVGMGDNRRKDSRGLYRLTLSTRRLELVFTPQWPGVGSYAWLLDGSGILVTAYERDQPPQIWFVPKGEATGRKITSDISAYGFVTPAADSKSFVTVRDTTDANVSITELDGRSILTPVTSGLGNYWGAGGVRWLNGQVLYAGIEDKTNTYFVADRNGKNPRRLIRSIAAWDATVSKDGTKIAFVSDQSGQSQIWVADASGDHPRQLTRGQRAGSPSFSPDGKSVVYLTYGESQFAWRVSVDGSGEPEQLTGVPTSRVLISPDGTSMLCRIRSTEPGVPLWRTAVLKIGSKEKPRYFEAPRFGGGPDFQWHPDGKSFVFVDAKDGVDNLWLLAIDGGGEPRQLTSFTTGEIFSFDLSTDGRSVVMSRGQPTSDAVLVSNWR